MPAAIPSLTKLTTLLVVDAIEACLPTWENLGFEVTVRVPEAGALGFVILAREGLELMLQTRASLKEDMPQVAQLKPAFLLYADVQSLDAARPALAGARTLIERRETFYGASESWLVLPGDAVIGLSQH